MSAGRAAFPGPRGVGSPSSCSKLRWLGQSLAFLGSQLPHSEACIHLLPEGLCPNFVFPGAESPQGMPPLTRAPVPLDYGPL